MGTEEDKEMRDGRERKRRAEVGGEKKYRKTGGERERAQ